MAEHGCVFWLRSGAGACDVTAGRRNSLGGGHTKNTIFSPIPDLPAQRAFKLGRRSRAAHIVLDRGVFFGCSLVAPWVLLFVHTKSTRVAWSAGGILPGFYGLCRRCILVILSEDGFGQIGAYAMHG